jgi:hypothetical protein
VKTVSTLESKQNLKLLDFSISTLSLVAALLGIFAGSALAQAPANDNFADATAILALPFSDSVDNTMATTESGEPQNCNFFARTVWYSFTPSANAVVRANMAGSTFGDTYFNVYQAAGPGFGGLNLMPPQCYGAYGNSVDFPVQAGITYYLQAGDLYSGGGLLQVNLQEVPPPPNDDFANATPIAALPFDDTVDNSGATQEVGEPTPPCTYGSPVGGSFWYAYTPATSGSVSASLRGYYFAMAAYAGNSLAGLSELGCASYGGALTFHANAGTTYFIQVSSLYGQTGALEFHLDVTQPPVAYFSFSPGDPSIFDNVQFYDYSYDPGQVGFQSFTWDFGDGATASGGSPSAMHQYAADGDYTVHHSVTTVDGRSASTSDPVHVQTHDVAIIKFSAPTAARAGQTRQISVGVNSKRYPETVQVSLLKSLPGNCFPVGCFEVVGSLTQSVPVRPSNRTTDFNFSYTFTSDDAAIGKVTFAATASIVGARDALQADNQAVSSPTKVTK